MHKGIIVGGTAAVVGVTKMLSGGAAKKAADTVGGKAVESAVSALEKFSAAPAIPISKVPLLAGLSNAFGVVANIIGAPHKYIVSLISQRVSPAFVQVGAYFLEVLFTAFTAKMIKFVVDAIAQKISPKQDPKIPAASYVSEDSSAQEVSVQEKVNVEMSLEPIEQKLIDAGVISGRILVNQKAVGNYKNDLGELLSSSTSQSKIANAQIEKLKDAYAKLQFAIKKGRDAVKQLQNDVSLLDSSLSGALKQIKSDEKSSEIKRDDAKELQKKTHKDIAKARKELEELESQTLTLQGSLSAKNDESGKISDVLAKIENLSKEISNASKEVNAMDQAVASIVDNEAKIEGIRRLIEGELAKIKPSIEQIKKTKVGDQGAVEIVMEKAQELLGSFNEQSAEAKTAEGAIVVTGAVAANRVIKYLAYRKEEAERVRKEEEAEAERVHKEEEAKTFRKEVADEVERILNESKGDNNASKIYQPTKPGGQKDSFSSPSSRLSGVTHLSELSMGSAGTNHSRSLNEYYVDAFKRNAVSIFKYKATLDDETNSNNFFIFRTFELSDGAFCIQSIFFMSHASVADELDEVPFSKMFTEALNRCAGVITQRVKKKSEFFIIFQSSEEFEGDINLGSCTGATTQLLKKFKDISGNFNRALVPATDDQKFLGTTFSFIYSVSSIISEDGEMGPQYQQKLDKIFMVAKALGDKYVEHDDIPKNEYSLFRQLEDDYSEVTYEFIGDDNLQDN